MTSTQQAPSMTEEEIDATLQRFADGFAFQRRAPLLHSPTEVGL